MEDADEGARGEDGVGPAPALPEQRAQEPFIFPPPARVHKRRGPFACLPAYLHNFFAAKYCKPLRLNISIPPHSLCALQKSFFIFLEHQRPSSELLQISAEKMTSGNYLKILAIVFSFFLQNSMKFSVKNMRFDPIFYKIMKHNYRNTLQT